MGHHFSREMEQSAWVRAKLFLAPCLDWLLSQGCGECWAGLMHVLYKEEMGCALLIFCWTFPGSSFL